MDERALLAILTAIIFAGGDDSENAASYTPKGALIVAKIILDEATKAFRDPMV